MAEIEIEELTETNVRFRLAKTSLAFANSLRRIMIAEIPTLAIEVVEYDKNNTVLPEEMTTDRLGLVPIDSRAADSLKYPGECTCEGACASCAVVIDLDVSNTGDATKTVTSRDLVTDKDGPLVGDVASPSIITKLGKNQSIKCKCIARKGVGQAHAKWSPVSTVAFGYDGSNKHRHTKYWYEKDPNEEWPAPWFMDGGGAAQSEEFIADEEPSLFHFNVEVIKGCLEPLDVLRRALRVLEEKLTLFISQIEEHCSAAAGDGPIAERDRLFL